MEKHEPEEAFEEKEMRLLAAIALALLSVSSANAGTLKWGNGWASTTEPLNFAESYVSYDYYSPSRFLKATYSFIGAKPKKLYQVGIHLFCSNPILSFGQFSTNTKSCVSHTIGGVTKTVDSVELGMLLTDSNGSGNIEINVGPLNPGTYYIQFTARIDAGCYMTGYPSSYSKCSVLYSAPAGFGQPIKLVVK